MASADERWRAALARWAVPPEILAAAPEDPWGCPPALFAFTERATVTPSTRAALDALDTGGTVLDVGAGGGAASLALASRHPRLMAVDESPAMLSAFGADADRLGLEHVEIRGTWPDVAALTPVADVTVCNNVLFNVPNLDAFVRALSDRTRARVVCQIYRSHPAIWLNPLWKRFHGIEYADEPVADDAIEVIRDAGCEPEILTWMMPSFLEGVLDGSDRAELIAFARRRLCLPSSLDGEIEQALRDARLDEPRLVYTIWWHGAARD